MPGQGPVNQMGTLLAKAQADEVFREQLLADPVETLRAEGVNIPPGIKVKVLENSADLIHIVLPAKQEALSDESLSRVTAGTGSSQKPCGNKACRYEYDSAGCWWLYIISFGTCVNNDNEYDPWHGWDI